MHAEHPLAQDNVRGDTGAAEEPPVDPLSSSREWMSALSAASKRHALTRRLLPAVSLKWIKVGN